MSIVKKSFLVYYSWEDVLRDFTNEQKGILLSAMFAYAIRDEEIELKDPEVKTAFKFIKTCIKEDAAKYEKKCKQNAENGAKGGRPSKAES